MRQRAGWGAFFRLWLVLFFSYAGLKFALNFYLLGGIAFLRSAFVELLVMPLGQAIVFWVVTRRTRQET